MIVTSSLLSCFSDSQQLFVGNMPHGCTEEDLSDLFSKFGRVLEVRINQKQGRDTAARGRDGKTGFVSILSNFFCLYKKMKNS